MYARGARCPAHPMKTWLARYRAGVVSPCEPPPIARVDDLAASDAIDTEPATLPAHAGASPATISCVADLGEHDALLRDRAAAGLGYRRW